jgi:hypothetical protein
MLDKEANRWIYKVLQALSKESPEQRTQLLSRIIQTGRSAAPKQALSVPDLLQFRRVTKEMSERPVRDLVEGLMSSRNTDRALNQASSIGLHNPRLGRILSYLRKAKTSLDTVTKTPADEARQEHLRRRVMQWYKASGIGGRERFYPSESGQTLALHASAKRYKVITPTTERVKEYAAKHSGDKLLNALELQTTDLSPIALKQLLAPTEEARKQVPQRLSQWLSKQPSINAAELPFNPAKLVYKGNLSPKSQPGLVPDEIPIWYGGMPTTAKSYATNAFSRGQGKAGTATELIGVYDKADIGPSVFSRHLTKNTRNRVSDGVSVLNDRETDLLRENAHVPVYEAVGRAAKPLKLFALNPTNGELVNAPKSLSRWYGSPAVDKPLQGGPVSLTDYLEQMTALERMPNEQVSVTKLMLGL